MRWVWISAFGAVCSLAGITIFALLGNWSAVAFNVAPAVLNLCLAAAHLQLARMP